MKIALVHNRPALRNSERQFIIRATHVLRKLNCTVYGVNGWGRRYHYDSDGHVIWGDFLKINDVDFAIVTHFGVAKLFDAFSYMLVWSPVYYMSHDAVIRLPHSSQGYEYLDKHSFVTACHDAYIGLGQSKVNDYVHLACLQQDWHKKFLAELFFVSCYDLGRLPSVNFSQSKLFYVGSNWENTFYSHSRHGEVLRQLDKSDLVEFYGSRTNMMPKEKGGG